MGRLRGRNVGLGRSCVLSGMVLDLRCLGMGGWEVACVVEGVGVG
jgi:hypothetical protein